MLQSSKILGDERVEQGYFGQEINPTTYNLARINMFLHGIAPDKFDIARGDTLLQPQHWDFEPFDVVVSNPPYSVRWAGPDDPTTINDPRFALAGVLAPASKADWAFLMHMLACFRRAARRRSSCSPAFCTGADLRARSASTWCATTSWMRLSSCRPACSLARASRWKTVTR